MAEKEPKAKRSPKLKPTKKTQTVRERASAAQADKPKRIRSTAGRVAKPLQKARVYGKREYHLPLPDNKLGNFLRKRVRFVPKFFREAFAEIRQVTWPDMRNTLRLTMAVFIFAVVFSIFVGLLDFVLDKAFREFILN